MGTRIGADGPVLIFQRPMHTSVPDKRPPSATVCGTPSCSIAIVIRSDIRFARLVRAALLAALWQLHGNALAVPAYDLVGFATVSGMGRNGTTGGADGPHVQVSTLNELVRYAQTN